MQVPVETFAPSSPVLVNLPVQISANMDSPTETVKADQQRAIFIKTQTEVRLPFCCVNLFSKRI